MKIDWPGTQQTDPQPILYFSGHYDLGVEKAMHAKVAYQYRCLSFNDVLLSRLSLENFKFLHGKGVKVFLDSGAFTVQKDSTHTEKTASVYMNRYCDFLDEVRQYVHWYATFDWRREAAVTWTATQQLNKRGYYPVPVYHGNDPYKELERYFDQGCRLVAIAKPFSRNKSRGLVTGHDLRRFYDHCHELAARHNCLLHGLALTGELLWRFPWYSGDSTSWLDGQRRGTLCYPDPRSRRLLWCNIRPYTVAELEGRTSPKQFVPPGWNRLHRDTKANIEETGKRFGFSLKDLLTSYRARNLFNMHVQMEFADSSRPVAPGRRQHGSIL